MIVVAFCLDPISRVGNAGQVLGLKVRSLTVKSYKIWQVYMQMLGRAYKEAFRNISHGCKKDPATCETDHEVTVSEHLWNNFMPRPQEVPTIQRRSMHDDEMDAQQTLLNKPLLTTCLQQSA